MKPIKMLFDVLAVICGICIFAFSMALDSPTDKPMYICIVCSLYLLIYIFAKADMYEDEDDFEEFEEGDEYDVD